VETLEAVISIPFSGSYEREIILELETFRKESEIRHTTFVRQTSFRSSM
jgi:hypothetical protein